MPVKTVNLLGSNDGTNYTAVTSWERPNIAGWQETSFAPSAAYRYWRINLPDTWSTTYTTYRSYHEIEMQEYTTPAYASSGYITTTNTTQLDTTSWIGISSIAIGQTTPANTSIKHLISFDGRTTWKYWNGSAWTTSDLADIGTNGNTSALLEALDSSDWSANGGFINGSTSTFNIASYLETSNTSVTPTLNQIAVNYIASPIQITFDGLAATNITLVNEQTITATTPAHGVGAVDVVVTNPDGGTDTLVGGFTYSGPQVSSISPDTGAIGGGTTVNISGAHFFDNATITPTDNSLDFDTADEGDFIQQNASAGTDFTNGAVTLAQTSVYGADQTSAGLTHTLQSGSAYGGSSVTALSNNSTDTTGDTATNILVQSGFSGNQGLASIDFVTPKTITQLVLSNMSTNVYGVWQTMYIRNFKLQGSNTSGANAGPWTDVYTGVTSASAAGTVDTFTFTNTNAYRYYRIFTIDNWGYTNYASLAEWEMMESTGGYSQTPSYVATSNTIN